MNYKQVDFDHELLAGRKSYEGKVGKWWVQQADNAAHNYAYRKIADFVLSFARRKSPVIVDYGCGSGKLLSRLFSRFPHSEIYGLDGSSFMLDRVKERLKRMRGPRNGRVKVIHTELPDFSLPRGFADIAVLAFPNIVTHPKVFLDYQRRYPVDAKGARNLTEELQRSDEDPDAHAEEDSFYEALLMERIVSRNLRGLIKKGGICVRVDYMFVN